MTCCNYTKGCALSWAMPTSLWEVKLILQYLCIDMFGNVNWGVKTNQCYPGEMWTYLAQKLLHNTVGSLLVTCNFKLTGKVTLNSLCPWKPQVHTKVNHILEHHVKALVKNQKCIMRRKNTKWRHYQGISCFWQVFQRLWQDAVLSKLKAVSIGWLVCWLL